VPKRRQGFEIGLRWTGLARPLPLTIVGRGAHERSFPRQKRRITMFSVRRADAISGRNADV
jgi:hypothetical protein